MDDLTPSFEPETGQVILDGLPAGVAGEASLIPVPGLDMAFDRADGRLCRVVVDLEEIEETEERADTTGTDEPISPGKQVAAILTQLFGAQAPNIINHPTGAPALSPNPEYAATLSSLACLNAARATSPVPPCSAWWAFEAAELAERAGLHARARVEARRALAKLSATSVLPEPAARAALAVAAITAPDDPGAAAQLREAIEGRPPVPEYDVAHEVESLEKDQVRLDSLHWMLDPDLVPEGLFRPGLSPYSDLSVRHEGAHGRIVVEAILAPGADCQALDRCLARLVDPEVHRVLAQAAFTKITPDRVRAELHLPFPLDELPESWIEVVQDKLWPVRSPNGHRIRRALRWADAALRAERAPAGLAPHSTHDDWMALAATAWGRCRCDWEAAGDDDRAAQAARRQATVNRQPPPDGPAYLAEALGY